MNARVIVFLQFIGLGEQRSGISLLPQNSLEQFAAGALMFGWIAERSRVSLFCQAVKENPDRKQFRKDIRSDTQRIRKSLVRSRK